MEWRLDTTGRFSRRPYYTCREIDQVCERIVESFLIEKYTRATYPLSTEDLTILIERDVEYLDLYTDFPEDDIEGRTGFAAGGRPAMQVARYLSEDPRLENRQRTTLAHEYAHVKLQGFLYQDPSTLKYDSAVDAACKTRTIISTGRVDWLEWQAGYGSGAMLMPATALHTLVEAFLHQKGRARGPIKVGSRDAESLVKEVQGKFAVSSQAAEVRLFTAGILHDNKSRRVLEEESSVLIKPDCVHPECQPGPCRKVMRYRGIEV